jgi:gamma-aminobutyric acid receptor subunit beta
MNIQIHRLVTFVPVVLAVWLVGAGTACGDNHTGTRPGHGGEADEVTVKIGMLDIVDIDNRAQTFSVDLYVEIHWRDPRLVAEGEEVSEIRRLPLSEVWSPALVIVNDRGLDLLLPERVTVDGQGNVVFRQRIAGPLAVDLDLRKFPFDTQRLPIQIVSYQYSPEELVFSPESMLVARFDDLSDGEWNFEALETETSVFRLSDTGKGSSQLTFAIQADRAAGYYVITLAVPMTLILFLAWLVHWLPPELVPPRMGMASATVFSLIALGVSFRLTMPAIGYLTAADRFVLYSTLLLIASLAVTVASVRRVGQDRVDDASRLTRQARIAFPIVYIGILTSLAI